MWIKIFFSSQNYFFNLDRRIFSTFWGTKLEISPPSIRISLTRDEEIFENSSEGVRKNVSIFLSRCLFMPASWNSYSKSETARKPLRMIWALIFLAKSTRSESKAITSTFFKPSKERLIASIFSFSDKKDFLLIFWETQLWLDQIF